MTKVIGQKDKERSTKHSFDLRILIILPPLLVSNASSHTLVVIYQLIPHMDVYMYFTTHTLRSSFQFVFRLSSHCKVYLFTYTSVQYDIYTR
jgi:hypothetical protein